MFILFVCFFVQEMDYSMSYVHHDTLLIHEQQPCPSRRSLSFSNRMSYHERHLFEVKCLHDIRMHITLYKYDMHIRGSSELLPLRDSQQAFHNLPEMAGYPTWPLGPIHIYELSCAFFFFSTF